MRSFELDGVIYRSIPDFCRATGVSYGRMIRLCRTYVRAQKDPAVAARWILGTERLDYVREPRTMRALRDVELSRLRAEKSYFTRLQRRKRKAVDIATVKS